LNFIYLPPMVKLGNLEFKFGIRGCKLAEGNEDHTHYSSRGERCKSLCNQKI